MASIPAAAPRRLWSCFGHFRGVQCSNLWCGFRGSHRAREFFDEPFRAIGIRLRGRDYGLAQFFWDPTLVCGAPA